ncbi:SpoIID/LytB domain-containing protein [bacterium]|nr:SpoIID/LytB domain-containing protein [bacterium]
MTRGLFSFFLSRLNWRRGLCLCLGMALILACQGGKSHADQPDLALSTDFRNLQERQYFLRIGIVEDSKALRVVPDRGFLLHDQDGRVLYRGPAELPLLFTCLDPAPMPHVYYYELKSFRDSQRQQAEAFLAQARGKLDVSLHLMPDPRLDRAPLPNGKMPSPLPLAVVAGPYDSYKDAVADNARIGRYYRASLFRALPGRSTTKIRVQDAFGKTLAESTAYMGVRCNDLGDLLRGGSVEGDRSKWAMPAFWQEDPAYHGILEVWGNKKGQLTLVNRVFIEDYLYGVVPPEIGNSVPFEMKKVQAVISRSVAIAKLRRNLHSTWHYDLCASSHCQTYEGALAEDPICNAAVDATWGQVCVHEDIVINAVYSLCCGGVTANSEDAWQSVPSPYLRGRIDDLEGRLEPDFSHYETAEKWVNTRPEVLCNPDLNPGLPEYAKGSFRWSRTYSAADLRDHLSRHYQNIDKVTNIRIARRTRSGLITKVLVDTVPRGTLSLADEMTVRSALGGLPSPFFTLEREFDANHHLIRVTLKGAGEGHGVGLCQLGAISLILKGKDYLTVLKHYYQDIDIYKIYQ